MIKDTQAKASIWSAIIAAVVAVLVAFVTAFIPRLFDRYDALEKGLNALAAQIDVVKLKDEVDQLAAQMKSGTATPNAAPALPPATPPTPAPLPRH